MLVTLEMVRAPVVEPAVGWLLMPVRDRFPWPSRVSRLEPERDVGSIVDDDGIVTLEAGQGVTADALGADGGQAEAAANQQCGGHKEALGSGQNGILLRSWPTASAAGGLVLAETVPCRKFPP